MLGALAAQQLRPERPVGFASGLHQGHCAIFVRQAVTAAPSPADRRHAYIDPLAWTVSPWLTRHSSIDAGLPAAVDAHSLMIIVWRTLPFAGLGLVFRDGAGGAAGSACLVAD